MNASRPPVLVYDGDCGICEASSRFLASHTTGVEIIDHHTYGLAAIGAVWFVDARGRHEGPRAIREVLRFGTTWWVRAAGVVLGLPVIRHLAIPIYALIARNRSRISRLLGMTACGVRPVSGE